MTDDELLSQLLLVGWPTVEPNEEILRWIRERNIGGIKVFGWNGENVAALTRSIARMQAESVATRTGIPLFTATDQEGGWVRHIKDTTSITPGNMAIGASGLPYDARQTGYYIGMELRSIGVNMNFAPTVDVYINPEAHVIGPRAFSSDPVQTGILGTAYYRGLEEARVIATAKHFPGHGNAAGDSHGILPRIDDDWDTLWERDLLPFRMLIREGVPAVLSGHLSFPMAAGEDTPASLSTFFKDTVLRDRIGYNGIVITDDLYMGGAVEYGARRDWEFPELCRQAILAGNDMIMLSVTPTFAGEIWNVLRRSMDEDRRFRTRVVDAARRIIRVKLDYLRPEDRVPLDPVSYDGEELAGTDAFFLDQAGRSVTVVRDASMPLRPGAGRVLLAGKDRDFFRIGQRMLPGAETFAFSNNAFYTSSEQDRSRFAALISRYDTVVFLLSDPNSLEVLQAAREYADRIVVYSILTPIYLREVPWVQTAIAVYGWGVESFETGFAVLRGDVAATGTLPITIEE